VSDLEERIAEIERRLALLEARDGVQKPAPISHSSPPELPKTPLVALAVSNKRYDQGDYEAHIWFDCIYTLSQVSRPTRAVKGMIEFSDLFGNVKFRIQVTINSPLAPGKPLANPGIGFTYNQFMQDHQWVLATDLNDIKCNFVTANVIYSDGTSESFA